MSACSACAGDYEDPERTAWALDDLGDEDREEKGATPNEELPAEE